MTKEAEILAVLMQYVSAFPNAREMPEATLAIYGRALSTLSPAEVNAAMMRLVRTAKFFPTISEILDAAKTVKEYVSGMEKPTADEAWEMVMQCSKKIGLMHKWELPEDVNKAVRRFGKEELCRLEMNAVNTARAQFMRMYDSILRRSEDRKENEDVLKAIGRKDVQKLIGAIGNVKQIERKKVNKDEVVSR